MGRNVSLKHLFPALFLAPALMAAGQSLSPDGSPPPDPTVGSYYLVMTSLESSPNTHLFNPAPAIQINAASPVDPKDATGAVTLPPEFALESLGTPRFECVAASTRDHACEAIDRCDLTIRDPNTLEYHVVNHGGAAQLKLNLQVHDVLPVSQPGGKIPWKPHDVIFVSVPKPTPSFHFVSEVLVGEWNHEAVVFEVGKPLPASAKKALDDLGVHQDLGDKILYSFRVKEPAAATSAKTPQK